MKFSPKSDEDLKREMLIPAGEYDFSVIDAEEKNSSKGHPMIELQLIVWHEGNPYYVRDWLMTSLAMQQYKVNHFCRATGLMDRYNAGELGAAECKGCSGQLKLGIKEDKTGQYGPQNNVKDYVVDSVQGEGDALAAVGREPSTPEKQWAKPAFDHDDSVPF